jgi:ATP-dependent protease HslVU (ClpYQ) peptidase subunit
VTIVIGKLQSLSRIENEGANLVTETGLVMAADTEETAGDFKRSTSKLEEFRNLNGSLIIGGAGCEPQIQTITQLLQDKFKSWDGKDADNLQESFKETIKEHYRAHVLSWPTMQERGDNDFSLLIGLALPALDDLRLLVSQAGMLRRTKTHAAIGVGASYASDLIEEHLFQFGGTISAAVLAAIYVIYRVKRNTPFCGKDTHVWQIVERTRRIPGDVTKRAEEIFKDFDDFLSGQLFAALSSGDKDHGDLFNYENVMERFKELSDELGKLAAEMEEYGKDFS